MSAAAPELSLAELYRLICNLLRVGAVQEVDHARALVRVKSGNLTSGWLRWVEHRAGTTRSWSPPTVGEQVMLLSPGGDTAAAVALRGIYSDEHPAPSSAAGKHRVQFADGASVEYDQGASALTLSIGGCTQVFSASGTSITGGGVVSDGDQVAGGISQINHVHGGVASGPATTGAPQ